MSISVRIVDADFCMETPAIGFDPTFSLFNQAPTTSIPVIRVYGPNLSGQKTCLHIHGVLPYFYVPAGCDKFSGDEREVHLFAESCERALQSCFNRRNAPHYIHNVSVVAGKPFYGYYEEEREFLKIYMYNPSHLNRLADLLVNGMIMGRVFQPHESHIPFVMQFLMDFNLYGMNMIDCSRAIDRVEPGDDTSSTSPSDGVERLQRQSNCELEFDTTSVCIMNNWGKNTLANPGLKAIWDDEILRQKDALDQSTLEVNIDNPTSPMRPEMNLTNRESTFLFDIESALEDVEVLSNSCQMVRTPKPLKLSGQLSSSTPFDHSSQLEASNLSLLDALVRTPLSHSPRNGEILDNDFEDSSADEEEESRIMSQAVNLGDLDFDESFSIPQLDGKQPLVVRRSSRIAGKSMRNSKIRKPYVGCKKLRVNIERCDEESSISHNSSWCDCTSSNAASYTATSVLISSRGESSTYSGVKDPETLVNWFLRSPTPSSMPPLADVEFKSQDLSPEPINDLKCQLSRRTKSTDSLLEALDSSPGEAARSASASPALSCSPVMNRTFDEWHDEMLSQDLKPSTVEVLHEDLEASSDISLFSEKSANENIFIPVRLPPSAKYIMKSLKNYGLHEMDNCADKGIEVAPKFESSFVLLSPPVGLNINLTRGKLCFTPARKPPVIRTEQREQPPIGSGAEILVEEDDSEVEMADGGLDETNPVLLGGETVGSLRRRFSSQWRGVNVSGIETVTPTKSQVSGSSQGLDSRKLHQIQNLTVFSMELHVPTRASFLPDPQFDTIAAIFYCVFDDGINIKREHITGMLVVSVGNGRDPVDRGAVHGLGYKVYADEKSLLEGFLELVVKWDPDMLVGFEVQSGSWGYALNRARAIGIDLAGGISRVPGTPASSRFDTEQDAYGSETMSELHIAGRITLNMWRVMKHEAALTSFTFENMCYKFLKKRVPVFSAKQMTAWFDPFKSTNCASLYKVVNHYRFRVTANIQLLLKVDLTTRTSEMARLFGLLFYEVLTRGSQFRVESMMIRSVKAGNFIAASPSIQQRAQMKAPEHIPLVLEPESAFYTDPVVVVDFQSLYPSMMIAYNYCFSTCLGRVECLKEFEQFALGALSYALPHASLKKLLKKKLVHVAPNGVAYVSSELRKGIISDMVEQILNTRIMVKRFMKQYKNEPGLYKMLDARQLGLKLIANVTYGYTAASYSGRMPCVEVADSIVRKARETLERAIDVVNNHPTWNARVVYGDTDSMFVQVRNASKETAFKVGQAIADHITSLNPKPVKLKFEKVYYPCVLITKKRYVGYAYETLDQKEPAFDAKGIETVRRDNCPIVGKMMEKSLRLLFETKEISPVKTYVQTQFYKVLRDEVPLQDFIFAKEYRGRESYRPGACVAALRIANKLTAKDAMAEPKTGDRVPYCIVYGPPGSALYELVRQPLELVQNPQLRLNALYYITKQILPSLNRVFMLMGVDVFSWFQEMPKMNVLSSGEVGQSRKAAKSGSITSYFASGECLLCRNVTSRSLCPSCEHDSQTSSLLLCSKVSHIEHRLRDLNRICASCTGHMRYRQNCVSIDCPVFHKIYKTNLQIPLRNEMCNALSSL